MMYNNNVIEIKKRVILMKKYTIVYKMCNGKFEQTRTANTFFGAMISVIKRLRGFYSCYISAYIISNQTGEILIFLSR